MPKIRDLGINVIPATMRPPEMGGGGGDAGCHPTEQPCPPRSQEPCQNTCNPSSCPPPSAPPCDPTECDPTENCSSRRKNGSDLPEDAVAQLRQQLHHQIAEQSTM